MKGWSRKDEADGVVENTEEEMALLEEVANNKLL